MVEIIKKPPSREGISCVIRAKNEAEWSCLSILSILEFADEIVFVDNSSDDGTLEKVKKLKDGWGIEKLKIFSHPPVDGVKISLADFTRFAFKQATKSWVFKWDADFIARTNQHYSIMELKEAWREYKERAQVFRISGPNLFGDHMHVIHDPPVDNEFCFERYMWRNKNYSYRMLDKYENLVLKGHKHYWHLGPMHNPDDPRYYFFHMQGLKSDQKMASRAMQGHWWRYCHKMKGKPEKTYDEFLTEFWGTADKSEQVRLAMKRYFEEDMVKRFDKIGGRWGDYPTVLKPYMENPRFEVVYEDGKPHHRVTHHDREIPLPDKV